jgi:gas vesicle protein
MADEFDLQGFQDDLQQQLKKSSDAFQGTYKDALNDLAALSSDDVKAVAPELDDMQKYDELITVVKEASRVNLEQAQLKDGIQKLGTVAVQIAQKVPSLAMLFA